MHRFLFTSHFTLFDAGALMAVSALIAHQRYMEAAIVATVGATISGLMDRSHAPHPPED